MKYTLDYEKYNECARKAIAEGQVLLKNDNSVLPLQNGSTVAVFGRIQNHYYKSGTGSGGMVNVNRVVGIMDALREEVENGGIKIYEPLVEVYAEWEKENPYDPGVGWCGTPDSQKEMPLSEYTVKEAADNSDVALCIIGRIAGEDKDNRAEEGSYFLTDVEMKMLRKVRDNFDKMVVVLNVGNIIDMNFVSEINPDSVLYAWQGGMLGGYGTVDVLTGRVNPSGKLADTIASSLDEQPAAGNFGDPNQVVYAEDIYVGYRYFETFKRDKVLYPFGFGLSYTNFNIDTDNISEASDYLSVTVTVTNIGMVPGKEVTEIYVEAPQGLLGKPSRVLAGFKKTGILNPGCSETLNIDIPFKNFASFDEDGRCNLGTGFVLEKGNYYIFVGSDVRSARKAGTFEVTEDRMLEALQNALGPVQSFEALCPEMCSDSATGFKPAKRVVSKRQDTMKERRDRNLPPELKITGDQGYKLSDVKSGKVSMDDFVAQMSSEELCTIIRAEGMNSVQVTAGTAAAFGGITDELHAMGIPIGCMDDGPSGMRLDSGIRAFSLPNGTLLACTFNPELNEELFGFVGIEMLKNRVDLLLGPGMNIHRYPLNGRNFEYFSEDPLLTGLIGSAQVKGLQSRGVTGVIKHFACNNQETGRKEVDPVVSERALREIYLRGFEIAVRNGANAVMTTYCRINRCWTAGNYDLNTTILREQWGFEGIVMTDWWAYISDERAEKSFTDFASMIRAQNDLYCVVPKAKEEIGDNARISLSDGSLSIGELQRTAANVCRILMGLGTFVREHEGGYELEIVGADDGFDEIPGDLEFFRIGDETAIDLSGLENINGTKKFMGIEADRLGEYGVYMTARSKTVNNLAQIPVVFTSNATPAGTFTFRGDGEWRTEKCSVYLFSKDSVISLFFSLGGLEIKELKFVREHD